MTVRSGQKSPFHVDGELRTKLAGLGKRTSFKAGTILFEQGDALKGVYLLLSGKAHLTAGEGAASLRRVCDQGSLLGLPATMRHRPYSLSAECIEDCECVHIPARIFTEFLRATPLLCMQILKVLAEEVVDLRGKVPPMYAKASKKVH